MASPPKSLCLLRFSALGDICHAVPVIRTLQKAWPETKLTWVIGKLEAELVGDIPGVEFIIFDKGAGWSEYIKLRLILAEHRFSILLHMQTSMRANIASFMILAGVRLGFDRARGKDYQRYFTTDKIPAVPTQHVMEGFLSFLTTLGIEDHVLKWDIPIPDDAAAFAEKYIPTTQSTLLISPCASPRFRNFRNWHNEGYAAIADYAAKQYGMAVILIGGPTKAEQRTGEAIVALASHPIKNLIGQTKIKELLALIQRADLVIAPDSGPAHIATATGTDVIGLYATTNPRRARPYLSERWLVNKYPEALRTFLKKTEDEVPWSTRVRREEAMSLITIEDVKKVFDQWAKTSSVIGGQ